MNKKANKMDKETLEQFLAFRKRSYAVKSKKAKAVTTAAISSRGSNFPS